MSFLLNLFSPSPRKKATAKDASETAEAAAEKVDAIDDPLSKFFGAADADLSEIDESLEDGDEISYAEWKQSRKQYLFNYLKHRLEGVDISDQTGTGRENNIDDECSFCSKVLDEEFDHDQEKDNTQDVPNSQDVSTSEGRPETQAVYHAPPSESKSEGQSEDEYMLETQPQTQLPTPRFPKTPASATQSTGNSKKSAKSIDTAELVNRQTKQGFISGITSGIKRRLGFGVNEEIEESIQTQQTPNSAMEMENAEGTPSSRPKKKRRVGESNNHNNRGLMCTFIPHVSAASYNITKLSDLNLYTKNLDLELCQVLRVWRLRSCKRMDHGLASFESQSTTQDFSQKPLNAPIDNLEPYQSYEDDGPFNTIYTKVLSLEIAQLDNFATSAALSSTQITNLASAPFQSGQVQLQKMTERKRRHGVKRVRIFFYNKYAVAMTRLLDAVSKDKKKSKLLISLQNIPAHCIMPLQVAEMNPRLQQHLNNPFGDEDHGSKSSYCICIGDRCPLKYDQEKLHFDDNKLEVKLTEMPIDKETMDDVDAYYDGVLNKSNVCMGGERESSVLIRRYLIHMGWNQPQQQQQGGMTILVGDENTAATQHDIGGEVFEDHLNGSPDKNIASQDSSAGEGTNSGETAEDSDIIIRPTSVHPLSDLLPLLESNDKKVIRSITVFGVVLGFSPPSLTATREWKMSMVLIDESLPTSITQTQGQTEGCFNSPHVNNDNKEVHVPSITVVLFVKNKSHLPVIRSAGDVVCCHNATLQMYAQEPQLLCNRKSSLVVVSPSQTRNPGTKLHDSRSPTDWFLSCSCHDDNNHSLHPYFDWRLANSLWRWGQRRLSSHPTMTAKCKLSIAGLDQPDENREVSISGDLTAIVTAIIPYPEHLRRRDTPRGYIRLWDGSGRPVSDPHPPEVAGAVQNIEDPPEKVLVKIESILKSIASDNQNQCSSIVAPISLTGRVINATIWEEELWQLIHKEFIIEVGSFVRLRNINNSKLSSGVQCLSVHSRSSLTPLPFDVYETQQVLIDHDARIQRGAILNPSSGILPGKSVPTATTNSTNSDYQLSELIRKSVPFTFTAQFYISRTYPTFNPSSKNAMENLCVENRAGKKVFRFSLHIFDDSTELDVLCLGPRAEKLIGVKAVDIASPDVRKKATETLNDLMTPGYLFEGEIQSVLGTDDKVYYILKTMNCVQADA